jgi:hypothetical protein
MGGRLDIMKSEKRQERPNCYHDPLRLLKTYRDVRFSLILSLEHHRQDFEMEYGISITEYLDDIFAAGIGFADAKLEHHANSMKRTAEMLKLIDTAAHLIRENNSEGEMFYWILYYAYFSPQKLKNADEIVSRVQTHVPYLTKDTYYRQRKRAIKTFASVLWGFTARGEMDILDVFV